MTHPKQRSRERESLEMVRKRGNWMLENRDWKWARVVWYTDEEGVVGWGRSHRRKRREQNKWSKR